MGTKPKVISLQLSRVGTPQLLNLADSCRVYLWQLREKKSLTNRERVELRQSERLQRQLADLFSQIVYFK